MDNILTKPAPTTDAEYIAEFEQIMAEIRQYEAAFDPTQAEIEAMQAVAERKAARSDALTAEINRMVNKLWGKTPQSEITELRAKIEALEKRIAALENPA